MFVQDFSKKMKHERDMETKEISINGLLNGSSIRLSEMTAEEIGDETLPGGTAISTFLKDLIRK